MQPVTTNPLARLVDRQRVAVLDGGMATTLEARGFDLDDELWSAKILLENPAAIKQVHLDFLAAGADCITTSSYQASLPGFRKRGLSETEGAGLLRLSIELAVDARQTFWSDRTNRQDRLQPLVAASVGPYGAFLADGSEYTGRYGVDDGGLREYHQGRWEILAGSQADLLACETIPSHREAVILLSLLEDTTDRWAWMSFSCRDETHLCDGSRLADVVRDCDTVSRVAAIGINCTSPVFIPALIGEVRKSTGKPVIVYPNRGERYDSVSKTWADTPPPVDWEKAPAEWMTLGAACIGGCCRIGPLEIASIRRQLVT